MIHFGELAEENDTKSVPTILCLWSGICFLDYFGALKAVFCKFTNDQAHGRMKGQKAERQCYHLSAILA